MSFRQVQRVWSIRGITPEEKLVLLALADHANDEGFCWPSNSKVAQMCGLSRETVNRILSRLENKGVILSEKAPGKVSKITLLTCDAKSQVTRDATSHLPVTQNHTPCDATSHLPVTQNHTPINKELLNQSIEPVNRTSQLNQTGATAGVSMEEQKSLRGNYPPDFEYFFEIFPANSDSKLEASVAYESARRRGVAHLSIVQGAKAYRQYCEATGKAGQFVTGAAKWLRGEKWTVDWKTLEVNSQAPPEKSGTQILLEKIEAEEREKSNVIN